MSQRELKGDEEKRCMRKRRRMTDEREWKRNWLT
jgi:hypothetical protein